MSRDDIYYVRVFGKAGARNESYALQTRLPEPAPPVATADRAILNGATSIAIDVIANDMDLDGDAATLIAKLSAGASADFSVSGNRVVYAPSSSAPAGVHRANYTVTDDQGLESSPAAVSVFVVDFGLATPWRNAAGVFDINDDGATSAIDALLVINDLNLRGSRKLPTGPAGAENLFGFLDPSGDGFISPLDALVVINDLNQSGSGEGESPHAAFPCEIGCDHFAAADLALASFSAELEDKRK